MLVITLDTDVSESAWELVPALKSYAVELSIWTREEWSEYNLLVLGYSEDACFVIPESRLQSRLRS